MSLSKKNKIIASVAIVGLLTLTAIYFYRDYRTKQIKELRQAFEIKIEQAEEYRNIQLDTARIYAKEALELVKGEPELEFEKNTALLTLSDIEFLRSGAIDGLYERVEKCEKWFRQRKMYDEAFRANLLRLEVKSFNGYHQVRDQADDLIKLANLSKSNNNLAKAYFFKMEVRDYTRKWEDDVSILDSARMFAYRANDSVMLAKIRLMSILPINASQQAQDSICLSLQESEEWEDAELECLTNIALARSLAPSRKLDSALYFVQRGIQESDKFGSTVLRMNGVRQKTMVFLYSFKFDSVIALSDEGIKLARKTHSKYSERRALDDLSGAWLNKGEKSKSIAPLIDAIEIAKETNAEQGEFILNQRLFRFLVETERYKEARDVIAKNWEIVSKKDRNHVNDIDRGLVLFNKGHLERKMKNFDRAIFFYEKAASYIKPYASTNVKLFYIEESILLTLLDMNKNDLAWEKYEYIIDKFSHIVSRDFQFLHIKGRLFFNLNLYDEAISAFGASIEKGQEKFLEVNYESHFFLSQIYEKKGDYKQAFTYQKKGQSIKDEFDKGKDQLELERLQSKYELAQKESEIQKLDIERLKQKTDLEAQENALESRRLYIIFLVVLLLLLAVIVISVLRRAKDTILRKKLQQNALEKERQIERLKAEESKRNIELKNQLFANISHEFRTPLTLINAPIEELMDKVDDEKKKPLEVIKRNSDHLLEMVDEILELSRLDAGDTGLTKKSFNLNAFFQKLQLNFEPIFKQKEIALTTNLPEESFTVTGDEYRLKMVLNNLLKNAFHHTPKSGEISLKVEKSEKDSRLKISVFNSGDWIDEQFLLTIFDRYARSKDKEYSGYGIGLSFCKKIVDLHGGEISAQNVEGEGGVLLSFSFPTTFEVGEPVTVKELKLDFEENNEEIANQEQTLLIVEDNLEVQTLLKEMLSKQYEILLADDGGEGIALAKQHQPDLIISDIMMPNVDGTQLTKTLKKEFATSHIPIILLTAKSAGHDKIAGLQTGADDYLTKPFSPKELRIRVKNLIKQREKLKRRFSKNVFLMPEEITSTSLDQEFLKKATQIVEENLLEPEFNVEKFCRKLALNRNSVHQKLKSLTGKSASQFINSIKLKKAVILLADERISIIEVSELSGFNNRQAFYKVFKEQFEMTPSVYRKNSMDK